MALVQSTPLKVLAGQVFAEWSSGQALGAPEWHPMAATCAAGEHRIWLVNPQAQRAYPVASPLVVGNLVPDLRFEDHIARDQRYSLCWRVWVRAMFVPRVLEHLPSCVSVVQKGKSMPRISTLGTFRHEGVVYAVEWHPGEIRVTDAQGRDAAVMPFKAGKVLASAAPGASAAPADLLDLLRERAIGVLEAEAAQRRGPWAALEQSGGRP